jgi:hypothetical protein
MVAILLIRQQRRAGLGAPPEKPAAPAPSGAAPGA